jgi:hypothetical protein
VKRKVSAGEAAATADAAAASNALRIDSLDDETNAASLLLAGEGIVARFEACRVEQLDDDRYDAACHWAR